jgi:uncharacterized protein YodC (DUF2158 family)
MADVLFKVGDVVATKLGPNLSPKMVVKLVTGEKFCICIWYNSTTHQFEEYKFPQEVLMSVS